MTRKLYQRLNTAVVAMRNCEKSGNTEWQERHERTISDLVYRYMPSGSGWDCGTKFDTAEWTESKMTFYGSYHHMDDGGYCGWTDHTITIRPSFDGIDMTISGRDRNEIKDYLHDCFWTALTQELADDECLSAYVDA
jgi:hypothetical protein